MHSILQKRSNNACTSIQNFIFNKEIASVRLMLATGLLLLFLSCDTIRQIRQKL